MTAGTPAQPRRGDGSAPFELADWRDRSRVFLRPIAAPSVLGLFGFAAATFIVSAHLAGWYGTGPGESTTTLHVLAPFAALFGGVAQFAAAMWSYIARDAIATAIHGAWGSFWMAFGLLNLLTATGTVALSSEAGHEAFAFWFFALAVVTACGAAAALFENLALTSVLTTLAVGSALLGVGYFVGSPPEAGSGWLAAGGWVLVASAILAVYTAAAMMLRSTADGRTILPLGEYSKEANKPGATVTQAIEFEQGEVGVRKGQ
jgi:succinate-acetate transporter protein